MKLPKSINIFGTGYTVREHKQRLINDCTVCDGTAELREKVINIFGDLPDDQKKKIFLHELIHAVCCEYNIDGKAMEDEGDVVDTFSCGLLDTIKRNGLWEIFR